MKKNVGSQSIGVEMITAADGTAFTGTVTVVITIDNGTQSASGGTAPAHEGNGYHSYTPTQAETNGDHLAFTFTGSGAIPATVQVFTMFPQTVDNNVLAAGATGFTAIDTVVDAILVDTGTTIPGTITTAQNDLDIITGASGVNLLTATQASIDAIEADTNELQADDIPTTLATLATATNLATVDTVVDGIQTDLSNATDGLGALKTLIDTVNTDLSNGTDGLGALKALIDTLDTVADAIKVTTDKITFTIANQVDSNVQSINDVTITGDGSATPFDV